MENQKSLKSEKDIVVSRSSDKKLVWWALVAACLAIGMIVWCLRSVPHWRNAEKLAAKALEYSYGGSGNIRIIGYWKTDSIIDYRFFSENDSRQLMIAMNYLSDKTMESFTSSSSDEKNELEMVRLSELSTQASRGMDAMMQQLARGESGSRTLTGWKVKIAYEVKEDDGSTVRLQRWFAIDPDGSFVLDSFTFPYLDGEAGNK